MNELKENIKRIYNSCISISKEMSAKFTSGLKYGTEWVRYLLLIPITGILIITSFTTLILASISELIIEEGIYTARKVFNMKETLYAVE